MSVEELLYKLNTKGINGDVLMSLDKGMGELWEGINHKEINVLKMSVRNILEKKD